MKNYILNNKIYFIFPVTLLLGFTLGYFMESELILSTVFFAFVIGLLAVLKKLVFK